MIHFKTLSELNQANGYPPPENPMLSILRCNQSCPTGDHEFTSEFYMIGFKKMKSGEFLYGRTKYDSDSGSMYFTKPQQVVEMRNIELEEDGFAIYFHEDFLNGHPLHSDIKKYNFFDYEANEALHLSPREEQIIWELYRKIETEYNNNQDEYSKEIILSHIDSILKYSQRFYKRQFINRTEISGKLVSKFNNTLTSYFESGLVTDQGLPTVKEMASRLHTSPRYLSDLLKQETGKTAIELIHIFLISEAKHLLKGADSTVSEIAYTLGFENLPYFSRLFKKETGISPNQYKKHLN
jgi:AraC-like DNA-binding protein